MAQIARYGRSTQVESSDGWLAIGAAERLDDAMATPSDAVELTAVLWPAPEGGFSALNPETGTTSEGETQEEALRNLAEATALYLDEFPLPLGERPVITTFHIADVA
jgi:predicted RNase H-like HicB family nuclease